MGACWPRERSYGGTGSFVDASGANVCGLGRPHRWKMERLSGVEEPGGGTRSRKGAKNHSVGSVHSHRKEMKSSARRVFSMCSIDLADSLL
jgi:hypothetical protein